MKLAEAQRVADAIKSELSHACKRIAIAGSVRRKEPEVGDIEIVCVPHLSTDLLGDPDFAVPHDVQRALGAMRFEPRRNSAGHRIGWGPRAFFCEAFEYSGAGLDVGPFVKLDVFCVLPPAQWGAIFAIRTGPAEYSQWLVTQALKRGMKCREGRLLKRPHHEDGHPVPTPEEEDFFVALGLDWVPPSERRVS